MSNSMRDPSQTQQKEMQGSLPVPPELEHGSLPSPQLRTQEETAEEQPRQPESAGMPLRDIEQKAKFVEEVHQYIREYIKLADQKATFFFAGGTALLAFLYKNGVSQRWLKPVMQWNILDMIAFVAMSALAISTLLSVLVIIPRVRGSRRGYIFWEAIAEYDHGRQYADELIRLSPASLMQVKAEHCFDLARTCRAKYWWLRVALWTGAVGLASALLVFLLV